MLHEEYNKTFHEMLLARKEALVWGKRSHKRLIEFHKKKLIEHEEELNQKLRDLKVLEDQLVEQEELKEELKEALDEGLD